MSRQVYFDRDNRGPSTSVYRPPIAMGRQRKFRDNPRGSPSDTWKAHMDAEVDVEMGMGHNNDRRFNPYGPQRHNSKKKYKKNYGAYKGRHNPNQQNGDIGFMWSKVTIPHGRKYGKEFILKTLTAACKGTLLAVNFQFLGNNAEFYVNDKAAVRYLRDINKKIVTPSGFKMIIIINTCAAPFLNIDEESLGVLKTCMSSRYDTVTHHLNLSKFHHDQNLKALGYYMPLCKPNILSHVVKIIKEHIPDIELLDISDNRMYTIEPLNNLSSVCKQLRAVVLKNNKLRNVSELNYLKGLELVDLILDGNPLCDDYKTKTTYISAVRERFPKLLNLDGHALPAPISFDLGPETCPPSKKSFFAADDVKDLVIQFLDTYYTIYDSGDRTKLLDAYHDQAYFSLCLSKHQKTGNGGQLASYHHDNRNLIRVNDNDLRFKLLKQGKLSIVTALSELPQTMHDPASFSVDIFHVSPGLMSFCVTGVFKEVGAEINNAILKTFSRTYTVVAQGTGFAITNETLFINIASSEQQSKAFRVPAPTPSPSPAPVAEEVSAHEKQLRVIELSKQTGMNLDFSTKCLEENDWDFTRALAVFLEFKSQGKLPPEAFISM